MQFVGRLKHKAYRDFLCRNLFAKHEVERQSNLYIYRNPELPLRVRLEAKKRIEGLPENSHPTKIKNRCIATGRGRGVFRAFQLARFAFRLKARANELPGVRKASW
ncbi:ribosomal protein subunit S14 [Schizosaccharomyces cryophilus OY26]|uniref:Ribosomal protein subunit S14 n=1 Tax=Schizosaccharomyces cryophilus (strain OY26 / ATCC MYA-4695 / CBS 11777 / NBRC 106824 / NRRL Y48691) TaxID=653667 RepID=S9VXS2_SCHCR|nr:ribosomal protein subunit S14 [Schizosaccharomyces cryophilus OY26]EPY52373.1 ribosomal protein subunit S14 [Schizosaccharomyces cryophilus OY26]